MVGFNEAGAVKPRKPWPMSGIALDPAPGFNEAGAVKPRKPLGASLPLEFLQRASMRPGR